MRRTGLLLLLCLVAGVALSIVLIPGEHERALMRFRDANYEDARKYYEAQFKSGNLSLSILVPLIEIYQQSGRTDRAAEALEAFVRQNPTHVEALSLLVGLCRDARMPGKHQHYLAALQALAPNPQQAQELANRYDFAQQYHMQIALLQHDATGMEATERYSRLLSLLASTGQREAAVDAVLGPVQADVRHLDAEGRFVLFRLLTDAGRTKEAIQLAETWLSNDSDATTGAALLGEWLLYRGYPQLALRLVSAHAPDPATAHEELRSVYIAALKATKDYDRLRALWKQRLAAPDLSEREEVFILYSLLDLRDYLQALPLLRRRASTKGGSWLFAYVETAMKAGRQDDLSSFLAAEFARTDASVTDRQGLVAVIAPMAPRLVTDFLRPHAERDPQTWAFPYVDALRRRQARDELVAYLDRILAGPNLDEAARGPWLHRMIEEGGVARALPHVRRAAEAGDPGWRVAYVAALRKLERKDELHRFLTALAGAPGITVEERRWTAELLLKEGLKKDALRLYRELAEGTPADSPEVRALVYLWGPRPAASELNWIEVQLERAPADTREGWLRLLLDLGGADRVVAWHEQQPSRSAINRAHSVYIEALAETEQRQKLGREIARAIGDEKDPNVLRRYAQLAADAGDTVGSERAWAAVQEILPDDDMAFRERGLLQASQQRYPEAEINLRAAVARQPADFETQFAFAEVLQALGRGEEARTHYQHALSKAVSHPAQSYDTRLVQALCLQRLGEKQKAFVAFEQLLKDYPNNRALKADFASILLQNNATDLAKHVLETSR